MGLDKGGVDSKVGWRATVGLHVDAPLCVIQSKGCQCTSLTQGLHLVYVFIASIVSVGVNSSVISPLHFISKGYTHLLLLVLHTGFGQVEKDIHSGGELFRYKNQLN